MQNYREGTAFDEWRLDQDLTWPQVGKLLGLHANSVMNWGTGLHAPSIAMAFFIEHMTKGEVPVVSWMALETAKDEFRHYMKRGKDEAHEA